MAYKDPEKRREYQRNYKREWYKTHAAAQKQWVIDRRHRLTAKYWAYKETLACVHCGENHPACLEFHHRDPNVKDFTITELRRGDYSHARLIAELEKCDPVCVNCHRKLHWERKKKAAESHSAFPAA